MWFASSVVIDLTLLHHLRRFFSPHTWEARAPMKKIIREESDVYAFSLLPFLMPLFSLFFWKSVGSRGDIRRPFDWRGDIYDIISLVLFCSCSLISMMMGQKPSNLKIWCNHLKFFFLSSHPWNAALFPRFWRLFFRWFFFSYRLLFLVDFLPKFQIGDGTVI